MMKSTFFFRVLSRFTPRSASDPRLTAAAAAEATTSSSFRLFHLLLLGCCCCCLAASGLAASRLLESAACGAGRSIPGLPSGPAAALRVPVAGFRYIYRFSTQMTTARNTTEYLLHGLPPPRPGRRAPSSKAMGRGA